VRQLIRICSLSLISVAAAVTAVQAADENLETKVVYQAVRQSEIVTVQRACPEYPVYRVQNNTVNNYYRTTIYNVSVETVYPQPRVAHVRYAYVNP
jgi:hypothetical protein